MFPSQSAPLSVSNDLLNAPFNIIRQLQEGDVENLCRILLHPSLYLFGTVSALSTTSKD